MIFLLEMDQIIEIVLIEKVQDGKQIIYMLELLMIEDYQDAMMLIKEIQMTMVMEFQLRKMSN